MVLHPNFIADHIGCSIPNTFVLGSRGLIGPEKTNRMLTEEIIDVGFFTRGIDRRRHTIRNRLLSRLLSAESMSTRSIKSCNQGFWRDDRIRVNGFNEDMTGWGREDNELGVRILNSGVKRRTLKFQALAYHLHHTRTCARACPSTTKFSRLRLPKKRHVARTVWKNTWRLPPVSE